MINKYIIRKGLKYLNSISILDDNSLTFSPKWTRSKIDAFPFNNEFDAQIIIDEIREPEIKMEKTSEVFFRKNNNILFEKRKKDFQKILKDL